MTHLILSTFVVYLITHTLSLEIGVRTRPERCVGNADLLYRFCCVLPPFFTREVAKECGGGSALIYMEHNVTGIRRQTFTYCDHWYCVLNKYQMITNDEFFNHAKFFSHLDLWATMNPAFTHVMVDAKQTCRQIYRPYLPLRPCEFFNFNMCIRNFITVECPVTLPTPGCEEQKQFYKECGKYFYR